MSPLWVAALLALAAPASADPKNIAAAPPALEGAAAPRPTAGPWVMIGDSRVDTRAPGALSLLKALEFEPVRPLLGAFKPREVEVLNHFVYGQDGVAIHAQTLPPTFQPENIGGYTFKMGRDGAYEFHASGGVFSPITPAVERAILRHFGVRPAHESLGSRLKRLVLRALDWAAAWSFKPGPYDPGGGLF